MITDQHTLSAERWGSFVKTHWGIRPERFRAALPRHQLTPEETFAVLVRAGERGAPSRLYMNRELEDRNYSRQGEAPIDLQHVPRASDGSIEGYVARMTRLFDGGRFCFRATELQAHDVGLLRRLTGFLNGLYPHLRAPLAAQSVIFVGNYDYTPTGVHTDESPIFQYVIEGRKTANFWPPATWEREPRDPHAPTRYLDDATTFSLEAGDIVYWPGGQYHVFASSGFSMGFSVSMPDREPITQSEPAEALGEQLARQTSGGFFAVPDAIPVEAGWEDRRLTRHLDCDVLLERCGDRAVLAADGHYLLLPARDALFAWFGRIREGALVVAAETLAQLSDEVDRAAVRQATQALESWQALVPAC